MSNPWIVVAVTAVLIVLSAFFVAVEFALLAAKRHRLEDAAPTSRAARAALRSSTELTVLLAGSQLGITACTLALGAVTKPAVHYAITPVIEGWGAPLWVADVAGFVLALVIVTFLHLVVGEMAPKSWAIAHPERSATLLAIPMRGFMWFTRPLLVALNRMANWCLVKVGVEPADQVSNGQNPDDLRQLVEHSASVGSLEAAYVSQLSGALDLQALTVRDLLTEGTHPTTVPVGATVSDVQDATRSSGHLRILVGAPESISGFVHVRDTLGRADDQPVGDLVRTVPSFAPDTPVYSALATMRETRNHLAVVTDEETVLGVITLSDVLSRLFPRAPESPTLARA